MLLMMWKLFLFRIEKNRFNSQVQYFTMNKCI